MSDKKKAAWVGCVAVVGIAAWLCLGCTSTSNGQGEWSFTVGTQIGFRQQGAASAADSTNSLAFDKSVMDYVFTKDETESAGESGD